MESNGDSQFDARTEIETLKRDLAVMGASQAGMHSTQAATQAGTMSTMAASNMGMMVAMATGSISLIVGMFLGMAIRNNK